MGVENRNVFSHENALHKENSLLLAVLVSCQALTVHFAARECHGLWQATLFSKN